MITFVYPYNHKYDHGIELRSSIRSIVKHFKHDFNVIIVGKDQKPDWYSGDYIQSKGSIIGVREYDTGKFLSSAISCMDDDDYIIWMNDDIMFVKDTNLGIFAKPFILSNLSNKSMPVKFCNINKGMWGRKLWHTIELCNILKCTSYNYETHTPYLFNVAKLRNTMNVFPIEFGTALLATSYYNYNNSVGISIGGIRKGIYGQGSLSLPEEVVFLNYTDANYKKVEHYLKVSYGKEYGAFENVD